MRSIIDNALRLIEDFEGFKPKPYLCPAGIATIGIGTTAYEDGTKVTLKDSPIAYKRAKQLLLHELAEKGNVLSYFLQKQRIELNDNQYSALLCFAYNLGNGPIIDKGRSLHEALLSKDDNKVIEAMKLYSKAKNKLGIKVTIPGLLRRRNAEGKLYLTSLYP